MRGSAATRRISAGLTSMGSIELMRMRAMEVSRRMRSTIPRKLMRAIQVAPVAAQIDSRKHHFLIAGVFQLPDLLQHFFRRQAAALPAHRGDDAEGAARVAAILDLQRGARAIVGKDRRKMELFRDLAHENLGGRKSEVRGSGDRVIGPSDASTGVRRHRIICVR